MVTHLSKLTTVVTSEPLGWHARLVVDTVTSKGDVQAAYLLAVSQALAFGPLLGVAQAFAFRPFTRRWGWWMAANLVSWLVVDAAIYLLSLSFLGTRLPA